MTDIIVWAVVVTDGRDRPSYVVDDSFMTQEAAELWAEGHGLPADVVPLKTAQEATCDVLVTQSAAPPESDATSGETASPPPTGT